MSNSNLQWYVVHAISGSEKRARRALIEAILREGIQEYFEMIEEEVEVRGKPTGEIRTVPHIYMPVEEFKDFQNKKGRKRIKFPGYLFVHCDLNTQVAHTIRTAPRVTGIMDEPLPVEEVDRLLGREIAQPVQVLVQKFNVGDEVRISEGAFRSKKGTVERVDVSRQKYRIGVSMFGRLTTIELDFTSVETLDEND